MPASVGWSWGLFLASPLAGGVVRAGWPVARSALELERIDAAWVGVDVLRIAAAIAGVVVLGQLTRRQRRALGAVADQPLRATSRTA